MAKLPRTQAEIVQNNLRVLEHELAEELNLLNLTMMRNGKDLFFTGRKRLAVFYDHTNGIIYHIHNGTINQELREYIRGTICVENPPGMLKISEFDYDSSTTHSPEFFQVIHSTVERYNRSQAAKKQRTRNP